MKRVEEKQQDTTQPGMPTHPVVRWVRRITVSVVLFLAALFVSLQFSFVQTFLSSRLTAYLSSVTHTRVTAERLKVGPFDGLVLEHLQVIDEKGDTMLHVKALTLSLHKNLFSLFRNTLDVSYVGVKGVHVEVVTEKDSVRSNIDHFIDRLPFKTTTNKGATPFDLDVSELDITDVRLSLHNKNEGLIQNINLASGKILIDSMSLPDRTFYLASIRFDSPSFYRYVYGENCPVPHDNAGVSVRKTAKDSKSQTDALVSVGSLQITNGWCGVSNSLAPIQAGEGNSLDYNRFFFENISVALSAIRWQQNQGLTASVKGISARDNKGFEVRSIACRALEITPSMALFDGLSLEAGNTVIRDRVKLNYPGMKAFGKFAEKVVLNCDFKDSRVHLADLVHFVPSLGRSPVIQNNATETLEISGRYFGVVNHLTGTGVRLRLGNKLVLEGSFKVTNLLDASNAYFILRMDHFATSVANVRSVIPGFRPPDNFYKLGDIRFNGRFDGYLEDFTAYGYLKSALGDAEINMKLNSRDGAEKARYSGTLNLRRFNLGWWSGNEALGYVDFNSSVQEGVGLTLTSARARLKATVRSLMFKGYEYKDFVLDGRLDQNTFNGTFFIRDKNINMSFDGSFEYLEKKAFLDFTATITHIDLQALHLSDSPFSGSAAVEIRVSGSSLNDFTGNVAVKDIRLAVGDSTYMLNRIDLNSRLSVRGTQVVNLESDLGTIQLDGRYDLPGLPASLRHIIQENYPYLTRQWGKDESVIKDQRFDFTIRLTDSRNFLSLLGLKNSHFTALNMKGRIDTDRSEISLATDIPFVQLNADSIQDIQLIVSSKRSAGDILLHIDSTYALGRRFNPIELQSTTKGDTISFILATEKIIDTLESLRIGGTLLPHEKGYSLSITDNLLEFLGTKWKMDAQNAIVFGKNYVRLDNVTLSDGYRVIDVQDVNLNKGLSLDISNFDVDVINSFINFRKMYFAGPMEMSAQVSDIFSTDREVAAYVSIPALTINKKPYGAVYLDVGKKLAKPYQASFTVGDFLSAKATVNMVDRTMDARVRLREAPLDLLEYILKDGIKETRGAINGTVAVTGSLTAPVMEGKGMVMNGATTVIYTGATYYFHEQPFTITNTTIDLDGAKITDKLGNAGVIRGGLTHNMFKAFAVKASISGTNVIGLSTTKADNPVYYGTGIGNMTAVFSGPVDAIDLRITAVTGPGTKLFIPIKDSQSALNQSFIRFVRKEGANTVSIRKPYTLKGMDIEMAITLTPDAEVSLIFDEAKGDIIRGRGRGNLRIGYNRQGDFEMFGGYEIEQGEYLFTVALLPVAKPFAVERGGRITWTGDPVNASLDITASYQTRTPVRPFIEEYLTIASENTKSLASQRSEVDLKLKLKGTLFQPEISFDLSFPNLLSDLSTLTDSKLRILRNNELELNSQVLGLIVFNSFLPSNRVADVFGASALQSAGINTLSEFLSSQLSLYITNLLNSALEEDGLISGIDFEVGVRNNNLALAAAGRNNLFPDEIEVRLKNKFRFMDERFSVNVGGNYVFQNQGIAINQVLPDFALEFLLTEDRKLKVRLYGKYDIDPIAITSLREKYGLGMAYRTEFGSMVDFEKNVRQAVSNLIDKPQ